MSKKTLLLSLVASSALGLSSITALANMQGSDVYVGGQIGYGDTHWDNLFNVNGISSTNDTGLAGGVFAGYDFNQNFAVEGGYTYFPSADVKFLGTKVGNIGTYGFDLVGKMTVPVADKLGVYAKAGMGYLHSSVSGNLKTAMQQFNQKNSYGNADFVYGLGANYNIMPNLVADVSFTRFNGNNDTTSSTYQPDADLYAVGLAYKFNI